MKPLRCDKNRAEYRRARRIGALCTVCVCALAVIMVFCVWFTAVRIDDDGMSPTLRAGDVVLFDRLAKYAVSPARGDIVACSGESGIWLGRITALPGETVAAYDGELYIDGILLNEAVYADSATPDIARYTLPEDCYFVLPDMRAAMQSDLFDLTVPIDDIYGRAAIRVAPAYRMGVFR